MANEEHLGILKQGVGAWNQWRHEYPDTRPDLCEADLRNCDLSGAILSSAHLAGADLSEAILQRAYLNATNLHGAKLVGADLSGAKLTWATLALANLSEASLDGATLREAELEMTRLTGATLRQANLRGAHFHQVELNAAKLTEANLDQVHLLTANLDGADLRGANLCRASFQGGHLRGTVFHSAVMGATTLANVDLSTAEGLDTVHHIGPSTIGVDTISLSRGRIPELFLRGAGIPDIFIEANSSLAGRSDQYHSCFILHSDKDADFTRRLHDDLQANGVCWWFAPKSVKTGDLFRYPLFEVMRSPQKLLLVLSKHSVTDKEVQRTTQAAVNVERAEARHIVITIVLDDAIENIRLRYMRLSAKTPHLVDFRNWKNQDDYNKALARLLRDLSVENEEREDTLESEHKERNDAWVHKLAARYS